jgi:ribosomal protein S18 acetylase RimI-like enzyme
MAALTDPMMEPHPGGAIIDLRELSGRELDPLLLEETVEWEREIDWDFGRSADLVRQFADMRALLGCALLDRGEVVGYSYSVVEENKGLIGDLYIRPVWRNGRNEIRLFRAILDSLTATPGLRRIESQLMLVDPSVGRALQRERFVKLQDRLLMKLDVTASVHRPAGTAHRRFRIEPWADHHIDMAAAVISVAYAGHVDSEINEQYRTVAGARRFIHNIVQYPGCGTFFRHGSFVAFDPETSSMAGIVLVSFVSDTVGHITQLCVTPGVAGRGLGYELLRQAINSLRMHGAKRISLTVTEANAVAVRLYRRCGFVDVRKFLSYVWEGR